MRVFARKGYSVDSVGEAYAAFLEYYRRFIPEEMDAIYSPKSPDYALAGLALYSQKWRHDEYKVLYTEVPGCVPIELVNGEIALIDFRIDRIVEGKEGIYIMEHKTATKGGELWNRQWYLSIQVGTYIHALNCHFPNEKVWGAWIDGVFFLKSMLPGATKKPPEMDSLFKRVPVRKTLGQMNNWMQIVGNAICQIRQNLEALEEGGELYFIMNPTNCMKYGICQYHDLCVSWDSPIDRLDEPPMGFTQTFWDPFDSIEDPDEDWRK